MEDSLGVGKIFSDDEAVKSMVTDYNKTHFTSFTISTNNKKSIVFKCKHGRKRKYDGKGKRPNQTYNFIGCSAQVNFYKNKDDGTLKVTKSVLCHNHECSKIDYERDNAVFDDEDEAFVLTLNSATARPSQIKRVLKEQRGKSFTTKKIQNLIRKLAPTDAEENVSFEDFLQNIENDGGTVEWKCDPDETVSALFIATKSQKSSVISSQPTVIQLDTSFGVDQAHYKLTAFCYMNPVTNKTEVASIALVSQESEENFDFVLSLFRTLYSKDDFIFLVDKDFTCIASIKRAYPNSTVLLCIFHVIKFLRTLFATALTTKEKKEEIMAKFKSALYARDVD